MDPAAAEAVVVVSLLLQQSTDSSTQFIEMNPSRESICSPLICFGCSSTQVLGPKARPIPALGNAQGVRKPLRTNCLPSFHRTDPGPSGLGSGRWRESGITFSFYSHHQVRWPWLVWVAPLVLKPNSKMFYGPPRNPVCAKSNL